MCICMINLCFAEKLYNSQTIYLFGKCPLLLIAIVQLYKQLSMGEFN